GIDHAVLNVAAGDLSTAIAWYENAFGFRRQQGFTIQTAYSGLSSQVLVHPQGHAQLPINEPISPSSQIQEFLDCNRGPGIQHVALKTDNSLRAIADLRQRGLRFLPVPPTYYGQLRQRADFWLSELQWQAIAAQQLLIDWQPHSQALLLQAFTQPIFAIPTFFFELIERRPCQLTQNPAQGFGEGNFRALFEAVEREQRKRTQPR
ncbi:MAG TPA: VOC family protein, partial [Chroococcidiopsis sp.]